MIKDAYGVSTLRYAVKYSEKEWTLAQLASVPPGHVQRFRYYVSFAIMGRTCPQGFG